MGGRQLGEHELLQPGIGVRDGHDRTVAGDNPQQAIDFDDLKRVDADRTIGRDGFDPFRDGTRSRRRIQGRHPTDTKERACPSSRTDAASISTGGACSAEGLGGSCAWTGSGAASQVRRNEREDQTHHVNPISLMANVRRRPASSPAARV